MQSTVGKMVRKVAVVGGGPAGLFAAETLSAAGVEVHLFDAKPGVARKFLVAGRGGLNLTHGEDMALFVSRYGADPLGESRMARMVQAFSPQDLRDWAQGLGIETFQASSGRVYPREMKAAPLLRRWLQRLRDQGVEFHLRHRLVALEQGECWHLDFITDIGQLGFDCDAVLLALGGASWARTGSDGVWTEMLARFGIKISPWQSANCGWEVEWDAELIQQAEGLPLKNILAWGADAAQKHAGELLITRYGLEGGLIYRLGADLRRQSKPQLHLNLKPSASVDELKRKMESVKQRFLFHCRERWRLSIAAHALLSHSFAGMDPGLDEIVARCQHLTLSLRQARPVDEAISSAGGLCWSELDDGMGLKRCPGLYVAGEMVDWEAPTGGYLMQGCFASGRWSAQALLRRLEAGDEA